MTPASERAPERGHVVERRGDAAVAGAAHGEVEHVGAHHAVHRDVAERDVARQLVGAQEARCGSRPAGSAHALLDELVEGDPAGPLGEHGEHDVAAVAVREHLVGRRTLREAVEDRAGSPRWRPGAGPGPA